MRNRKIIAWLVAFLPLIITLIVLPILPDRIPTHHGIDGEVTRIGSKYEVLIVPIFTIFFGFFWVLIEMLQKKEENKKALFWGNISVTVLFTIISLWTLYLYFTLAGIIKDLEIDFLKIMAVTLSICWLILGLTISKFKQNGLSGIRTMWTLKDENCWEKTHKFGRKVFVINGIVSILLCLFVLKGLIAFCFSFGSIFIVIIIVSIYSRRIYHEGRLRRN